MNLVRIVVLAALALVVLPTATASAGRLIVTGHDADLHCTGGSQCHFVEVATSYVRSGAPDPSKPVLVLDREDLDFVVALDNAFGPGAVPRVVMDPRSAEFASAPLTTDRYSAILIASDYTCGGCDLNIPEDREGASETPDSDAINARRGDIAAFFNAGGGVYANSGANHGDGDPQTGPDVYYDFVPLPLGGAPVQGPFCLTSVGASLGFEDQGCPDSSRHNGTRDDINCCATHNSFQAPDPASALRVAEVDVGSDGLGANDIPETLVAEGEIRGGEIVTPAPEPEPDTTLPDTPITSGPPAFGRDNTATFTFESSHSGSTFECSLDGGPFVACSSPFTTPRLAGGRHTFAVRAIDAAGNADPTPTVYVWRIAVELSELPRPVLGREVNVGPVPGSGLVYIGIPRRGAGARASARASQKGLRFAPLKQARQIPVGSVLKTRRGAVQLVSATGSRSPGDRTQSGRFSSGVFQVLQSRSRRAKGLTELRLKGSSFNRCRTGRRGRSASAAQRRLSRRTIRRLRGNARGRYRTRGRHSAATIRGTVWITSDRCDGTLTTVKRGKVAVRDFRRKRTITVRRGKRYLARALR